MLKEWQRGTLKIKLGYGDVGGQYQYNVLGVFLEKYRKVLTGHRGAIYS